MQRESAQTCIEARWKKENKVERAITIDGKVSFRTHPPILVRSFAFALTLFRRMRLDGDGMACV